MLADMSETPVSTTTDPGTDPVLVVLRQFRPVRNTLLKSIVRFLPWVIAVVSVPVLASAAPFDFFLMSGLTASVLALFAFQQLMRLIPATMTTVWNRGIVTLQRAPGLEPDDPANRARLKAQYLSYIQDFENRLNDRWGQRVTAASFGLIGVVIWCVQLGYGLPAAVNLFFRPAALPPELRGVAWEYVLGFFAEPIIGFILGLLAWRMVVTGRQVTRMGQLFDVTVQLGHPDRCGGLEPVGNLCLWNALIVTIPAIHLGLWIVIAPTLFPTQYGDRWTPVLAAMLPVPMLWAILTFFVPLGSIHRDMVASKAAIQRQLDLLGQSITDLGRSLLVEADQLDPEEGKRRVERLDLMRQIYNQNQYIPTWPFNLETLGKFFGAQLVPAVGLGKFAVDLILGAVINQAIPPLR